ncbi:MAG: DUF1028 domain-containing protein [Spirochaetaceae bacterium]|nr:MAG: DUF1028 domain-containing protein [Spirochaetaceae bacterium]
MQLSPDIAMGVHQMGEFAATYSIVAMDPATDEMGGAVQSHFFAVGHAVLWARAGVGVVATQSLINRQFGPDGLHLLAQGLDARDVLAVLLKSDSGADYRQVGVMDHLGNSAAHTGSLCIQEASHRRGPFFAAQANMMLHSGVPEAMETAFRQTSGPLAERLVAALAAAETLGGDIRGKQSAALVLVRANGSPSVASDELVNLHVEDHPKPVEELARLVSLYRGYQSLDAGDGAMERGNPDEAAHHYSHAHEALGANPEALFWHGIALLNSGKSAEGLRRLRPLFERNPAWLELTLRLPASRLALLDADTEATLRAWHDGRADGPEI